MRRWLFRRLPLSWRHRAYARAAMRLLADSRQLYFRRLAAGTIDVLPYECLVGIQHGLREVHEGKIRPWEDIRKELGLPDRCAQ
jgi:hypothetical protein